jgi:hypothetical protein
MQSNMPPKAYAILGIITQRVKAPAVVTALALTATLTAYSPFSP